ncbi:hypothetical protein C483_07272 [Natrialba hulunbeirensis JCM 10989]|uniref:Uncharacterized protein n=1 Tax=Natrialba hulunbeirensis JCM 10989 TaxID=1227493 RepID=M0A2A4_9EURY|nr:hypothetical protein [Natrialba hulunbeirensis]ELY92749.1 hypothetical protein C483_07272 [Natrialba hulunbeirensis JCM 10989]
MTYTPIAPRPIDPLSEYGLLTAAIIAFGLAFLIVASALVALTIATAVGNHPVVIVAGVFFGSLLLFVSGLLAVRRVRRQFDARAV